MQGYTTQPLASVQTTPLSARLLCPFPSAINPATAWAETTTTGWAERWSLLPSPAVREHFVHAHYATLMGRAYPTTDPDTLAVIADWNSWTFLVDNQLDHHSLGRDPQSLNTFGTVVDRILREAIADDPLVAQMPLLLALVDVAERIRARSTPNWMERFRHDVRATLAMCVREAWYREQGQIPSEQVYMEMRPYTSGVFCFLDLIEIATGGILPDHVRYQGVVDRLAHLTTEIIYLANDVVSLEKEISQGDGLNLVIIAQSERSWSLTEALTYVIDRHNRAITSFQRLQEQVPAFEGKLGTALQQYMQGLRMWIRANFDWSMETGRYRTVYLEERAVNRA
jgi:terpene synthase-like protein